MWSTVLNLNVVEVPTIPPMLSMSRMHGTCRLGIGTREAGRVVGSGRGRWSAAWSGSALVL